MNVSPAFLLRDAQFAIFEISLISSVRANLHFSRMQAMLVFAKYDKKLVLGRYAQTNVFFFSVTAWKHLAALVGTMLITFLNL